MIISIFVSVIIFFIFTFLKRNSKETIMKLRFFKRNLLVDFLSFAAVVIYAICMKWSPRDNLWSLWISSFLIGYAILLSGYAGNFRDKFLLKKQGVKDIKRTEILQKLIIFLPVLIFKLLFFTIHFGMFHFVISYILYGYFPLLDINLANLSSLHAFLSTWGVLLKTCLIRYWFFILTCVMASVGNIVSAAEKEEKVFQREAYKGIMKIIATLIISTYAAGSGYPQFILYAILVINFFPFRKLRNDTRETSETGSGNTHISDS